MDPYRHPCRDGGILKESQRSEASPETGSHEGILCCKDRGRRVVCVAS